MENSVWQDTVAVLWTGGWDSTYRVVELSRQDVNIQPVYILDKNRKSHLREIEAIRRIMNLLQAKEETKACFLPIDIVKVEDIPANEAITQAWTRLHEEFHYGIQHEWTARLAAWKYPMINMCIEKVTKGYMPTREAIETYGAVQWISGQGYVIDRDRSSEVLKLVLGEICLPIFETTEVEMLQRVKQWGYMDVMENIWFCHHPIQGKPCGLCSPCHTKLDSGMAFLLPEAAQRRRIKQQWMEQHLGKLAVKAYAKATRAIHR